jgi:hypothetical protein
MLVSFILQKGAPDLTNAILVLLAILLTILLLNSLYEWLRSKSGQNRKTPDQLTSNEEVTNDNKNEGIDLPEENSSETKFLDHGSLGLPIGC